MPPFKKSALLFPRPPPPLAPPSNACFPSDVVCNPTCGAFSPAFAASAGPRHRISLASALSAKRSGGVSSPFSPFSSLMKMPSSRCLGKKCPPRGGVRGGGKGTRRRSMISAFISRGPDTFGAFWTWPRWLPSWAGAALKSRLSKREKVKKAPAEVSRVQG